MNGDGVVDVQDLIIYIRAHGRVEVPWCEWVAAERKEKPHVGELFDFAGRYFGCDDGPPQPPADPLAVENTLAYPTRLALGPAGSLYVSDPKVGSVFIYRSGNVVGELKGLDKPLGIAVDSDGTIYVGNNGRDNVEKYSAAGLLVGALGTGDVRMPNDLALDAGGNVYVADSLSNLVWAYAPEGAVLWTLRRADLQFPSAVAVAYFENGDGSVRGELFVADQGHYLVKVFDLQGNFLRSFGGFPTKSGMFMPTWDWEGRFVTLQSLVVDARGDLHALDSYMNKVQVLDSLTGDYLDSYGEAGSGPGQLKLPLEIVIDGADQVLVANADKGKVEVIQRAP